MFAEAEAVEEDGGGGEDEEEPAAAPKTAKRKPAARKTKKAVPDPDADSAEEDEKPAARKKAAKKKDEDAPIDVPEEFDTAAMWERAHRCGKYVGAHVSAAGGAWNAVVKSVGIGGTAFALFVKNQRRWTSPPIAANQITAFKAACTAAKLDPRKHLLPHGSYLINLASVDADKATQAFDAFVDELKRCEELGIGLYNFHPGAALKEPRDEAIARIASRINAAHKQTESIVIVIENMAGQGTVIGNTFEDLRDIIALVEDKRRVGVCLDTCHAFAAGYDIRTPETYAATLSTFSTTVGLPYLRALHLNDSKEPLGSKKDRHENLGKGKIGWEAFRCIMNDDRLNGLPMVLETPREDGPQGDLVYRREVELLYSLVGKGVGEVPDGV
ncbi:xylose isomerase-like protein [Fimicolochytrium jonesii]|uniref:xylose isomerase-like protein n=1 Tax=Fimicolochytrium jonesii TaxID=1396493 RepID=UPI0022FDBAF0|nr:xylose isomerase-like protein [Fimicolochytrium jonesii]KAI8821369.1 xylose isomerase-like protein [Fimicolochytrium jonesii]